MKPMCYRQSRGVVYRAWMFPLCGERKLTALLAVGFNSKQLKFNIRGYKFNIKLQLFATSGFGEYTKLDVYIMKRERKCCPS